MSNETTDRIRETLATPAASEDLRERVRQAVEWGIEDAWPRYNRIYDPHDPDDESRQEWVDCITEQVVTALLRTPSGDGEDVQIRFPCGCVTCVCDDDEQCHGCGARSCGDRPCDAVREHFAARRGEGGGE